MTSWSNDYTPIPMNSHYVQTTPHRHEVYLIIDCFLSEKKDLCINFRHHNHRQFVVLNVNNILKHNDI